jgi:hypothetical protein
MRRDPRPLTILTLAAVMLGVSALTACSSSGSSTSTTTPVPTSSAGETKAAPTSGAASGAASSSPAPTPTSAASGGTASSSASLPGDACQLLTDQEVSAVVGGTITAHHASGTASTTKVCQYNGANGSGDHAFSFSVSAFADAATAHKGIQDIVDGVPGVSKVPNLGDEAIEYKIGAGAGFKFRRGTIVVTMLALTSTNLSALQTAATEVAGRF